MKKNLGSKGFLAGFFFFFFCLLFGMDVQTLAQRKNDFMVLKDSMLSQGYIKSVPIYPTKELLFKKTKREEFKSYSIDEVTEFQINNLIFLRKTIHVDGGKEQVFLELLGDSLPNASIWKLNALPKRYYLQTPEGMIELQEGNYQVILAEAFPNPELEKLIEITPLWELPLEYLSKTAKTWDKPRSFSKIIRISPYLGVAALQTTFKIDESDSKSSFSSQSPQLGLSGEFFLDFKRQLSFLAGVQYAEFDGQGFFRYGSPNRSYESDVFLDFSLLQVPLGVRYYRDIRPNDWRVFASVKYSLGMISIQKAGMFVAEFEENEVLTYEREFDFSNSWMGFNAEIGLEKLLSPKHSLTGQVQVIQLNGSNLDQISGISLLIGFKF